MISSDTSDTQQLDTNPTEKQKAIQRIFQNESTFRKIAAFQSQLTKRREIQKWEICSHWHEGNPQAWKLLAQALMITKKMHQLNLIFPFNSEILDPVFHNINGGLRRSRNLQYISFTFFHSHNITEAQVRKACQGIEKLVSVKKISLTFLSCQSLDEIGIKIIAKTIKKFKFLQNLTLHLPKVSVGQC